MMFKKISALLVGGVAIVGLLAGCSPDNGEKLEGNFETEAPYPTELNKLNALEFTVTETDPAIYGEAYWTVLPAVTNVTNNSFVLLSGESSSCPKVIKTVEHGEETGIPAVAVTYEPQGEQVCTDDFKHRAVLVETDGKFEAADSISFQLRTIDSLDVAPIRFIPETGIPEAPGVVENPVEVEDSVDVVEDEVK